jgi:hypothetical protein
MFSEPEDNIVAEIKSLFSRLRIPSCEHEVLLNMRVTKTRAGRNELKKILLYLLTDSKYLY